MKIEKSSVCCMVFLFGTVLLNAQTPNYVAKFNAAGNPTNSSIFDNGSVGIGTGGPNAKLEVDSSGQGAVSLRIADSSTNDGFFVLSNASWGYGNPLVQPGDQVLGYSGSAIDTGNLDIVPWSASSKGIRVTSSGNVGIGTTTPGTALEVNGSVRLTTGSGANLTFSDGTSQSTAWTGALCGGDYAESVDVTDTHLHYEPGDVLEVDSHNPGTFRKSSEQYSSTVSGIYSTKPGLVGRRFTDASRLKAEIPMAITGIVPTKVTTENGPIHAGDLLVTSSKVGYAMKGTDRLRMVGAIVGKALGELESGSGTIEVLVSLQ